MQAGARQAEEGGGAEQGLPRHKPPVRSLQQSCLEVLPPQSPNLTLWNDPRLKPLFMFHFILLEEGEGRENGFGWCF